MKYFVYGVIAVVVVMIIAGFFVVGSPTTERLKRFDERRVNDLTTLQFEIINYWQAKTKLPSELAGLKDDIRGVIIPNDPETSVAYEYVVKGDLAFELCATFSLDGGAVLGVQAVPAGNKVVSDASQGVWKHGVGRVCFERKIDPDLYPPFRKQ